MLAPPFPFPMPPPEEPTSLAEPVDWMAWPHAELYRMIHSGAGVAQAERTAQRWADVAAELHEIVDELGRAIGASEAGWQGEAAARAREGMRVVLAWATETVVRAERVRHAIHAEADHLEWARAAMPEPVPQWHGGGCGMVPEMGVAYPVMEIPPRQDAEAAHREAAEVMARFQQGSSQVDQTIPAFSAPTNPMTYDVPTKPETPPQTTPPPSGGTGHPGAIAVGPSPTRSETPTGRPAGGQVGGQEAAKPQPRAVEQQQQRPAAASTTTSAGRASTGMGGMAPGAGANREDDIEHRIPAYLREDTDVFSSDTPVAPPVLGADPHG